MNFLQLQNKYKKLQMRLYSFLLKGAAGGWGKNSLIQPPFHSNDLSGLYIGNNCRIHAGGWIDCIKQYNDVMYTPRITIGDNTYIGHRIHIIACGNMHIGNNVIIADGVYISDNLHGFEDINVPIAGQALKHPGNVTIEDEVWLGENVAVLPKVTIGKHAVIGANSVVTKSIPPYCVAVGIPAKVIKQYNQETQQWEKIKK